MPRHRISEIPSRLLANARNVVHFRGSAGTWEARSHREVHADVLGALAALEREGIVLGPGTACAIMGTSGYDWLVAELCCLFTGARAIAVPESLTLDAAREVLLKIPVDVALVDQRFAPLFARRAALEGLVDRGRSEVPFARALSPRLEHVAFTSGSTSATRLKAFVIDEDGTNAFIEAFLAAFGIDEGDTWAVCHTFSHVVHLEYVLGGLAWGYDIALVDPIHLVMRPEHIEPAVVVTVPAVYEQIAAQMRRRSPEEGPRAELLEKVLGWQVTPETRALAASLAPTLAPEAREVLGSRMKVAIIGAAPSSMELKRFLVLSGVPVYEGYGMSEVGMIACNTPGANRFGSVGRRFPGIGMDVSDDGILTVATSFVRTARYENVDDDDVFRDGLVHTGDIARIDEDGFLFITGRAKNLVISDRGKNVNPAPIEAALMDLPGVEHALVFGDNRPFLVALLVPEAGVVLDRSAVSGEIERLNETLAEHEQVVDFVVVDTLTADLFTRSGKVMRGSVWTKNRAALDALYD